MKKNISLGISADATGAVTEIKKVSKAQGVLNDAITTQRKEFREAKKGIADITAYETFQTSLGFTRGEIENTTERLQALNAKKLQHVGLTESETVSLKQHENTQKALNEKVAKGIDLTVAEQNRLIRSTAEIDRLTKKKTSYVKLTKAEQAEVTKLTNKLNTLNNKERAQTKSLSDLNGKLKQAGVNTNSLSMARDIANRRAQKAAQLLERENKLLARSNALQERRRQALESMPSGTMVAAGVAATAALAGRASMNNQANFVDVAKNVDFKDENDKQSLRRELNIIAVDMAGVNESDVMKIAAGGANGGIGREQLAQYTRDTVKTATAWDMSAEDAAEKGTSLRNSMRYQDDPNTEGIDEGRDAFIRMSNMINDVANNNGGVSGRDLLGVMSRRGAQLTNAGFTEQGALALSGSLLSKGATEEQAATATGGITRALVAGFSATAAQEDIYNMLGTDAISVAEGMNTDAMGTLTGVLESINDLDETEQSAAISQLFGEEAAPHVQKLLKDTKSLRKIQNDALKAQEQYEKSKTDKTVVDSITAEYNNVAGTDKAKFEQTGKALNNLAIAVGDRLMPHVAPLLGVTTELANGLANVVNEGGAAVDVALGLSAAALAVGGALAAKRGFNTVRNLVGIGKETLALNSAAKASEKHARALERQARASDAAARDVGTTKRSQRRTRRNSGRKRGKRSITAGITAGITDNILGLFSGDAGDSGRSSRRKPSRRRKGLIGLGVGALSMLAAPAFAGDGAAAAADVVNGTVSNAVGAAGDLSEKFGHVPAMAKAARFIKPLAVGIDAFSLGAQLKDGDMQGAASTGGGILGGLGGAALGATIGTFILPGIGTAIGGALGGMVGDGIGESIGETVFNWFSSDDVPDKTNEIKLAQHKQANAKQQAPVTFAPQLNIQGTNDPKETADIAMEALRDMFEQWQREQAADFDNDIDHALGA